MKNRSDSAKYIRDYNYQQFLNIYCETDIADYSNYNGYKEWKKTCPKPAGEAPITSQCSKDLEMKNTASVKNCTREGPESILEILRSKNTNVVYLFEYIFMSIQTGTKLYDCRPRTLYYYLMSWTILIYALIVGLGPTMWYFFFSTKIVDRIRHIKDFIDTIGSEDKEKKKEMTAILRTQIATWKSGKMMFVAVSKAILTLIVTLFFIAVFIRGFRGDLEKLAFTVCKVHNYEYAKCASARVGLIYFVWCYSLMTLSLICLVCCSNLWFLIHPGSKEKGFLVNLFKKQLGVDVFGPKVVGGRCNLCVGCSCTGCCSDLVLMSVLCERNRSLFGKAWRRFNRRTTRKFGFGRAKTSLGTSVRYTVEDGAAVVEEPNLPKTTAEVGSYVWASA